MDKNEIEIYKEVLLNSENKFPKNYWNDKGKEKSDCIFKYLFEEVLYWKVDKIITDFNKDVAIQYGLKTPFKRFYSACTGSLIHSIYPSVLNGKRIPHSEKTKMKISVAQKNLSKEKHDNIVKGMRKNRYTEEYAKKLSDTKLGEINPQHKLKTEQVIEIKKLWATGNYTTKILGEQFKISRQSISDIVYGRTWKHL